MTRWITCCIGFLLYGIAGAQPQLYIGADVAYAQDYLKLQDPVGHLKKPFLDGVFYGARFRYRIDNYTYVELGAYGKGHREGIAFRYADFYASGSGRKSVVIPLRFGLTLPLYRKDIYINPLVGYVVAVANHHENLASEGSFQEPGKDKYHYTYTPQYPAREFSLVQAGLAVDIRCLRHAFIHLSASYYAGMQKIFIQRIFYDINDGPLNPANSYTRGNFGSIGIGISYPLNKEEHNQ